MEKLQKALLEILSLGPQSQKSIIKQLENLVQQYGTLDIGRWRNLSDNSKNTLLHELVYRGLYEVLHYVLEKSQFDVNVRRGKDGLTPLQLAESLKDRKMCELLKKYGANEISTEDVSKWLSDDDREQSMNIVWIDLEMTSIEDPHILECAVIITDKNLETLERGNLSFILISIILS